MVKKNRLLLVFILPLFVFLTVQAQVDFTQDLFEELAANINPIPYIETPAYKRVELDNGMVFYLAEERDLPVIEVLGFIRGGMSQESMEQAGISSLMARLMNTGTKNFSELELSRYKELNGLTFSISSALDHYNVTANALSHDKEALFTLMAEVLRNPKFDGDYFYRIIQEYYQALLQHFYYDSSLLDMYFNSTIYGDHPYGYNDNLGLVVAALQSMTPAAVESFYQENIDPANIIMAISGDFDLAEMEELLREKFADWETKGTELEERRVEENEANYNRIILVNKPDATQAKMKMGYSFYDNSYADRVAFTMANLVFGGGDFSSRLMDNLRSKQGYVYGIYSNFRLNERGGLYFITTDVAPEKACETREAIKAELLAVKEGQAEISEEELFRIVNLYNAFFPKTYKEQISVLSEIMYAREILGEGEDYINNYISEYNNLSAEEVQEVFARDTFPERFLTVIVGKKEDVLPAFQEQGIEVEVVELF